MCFINLAEVIEHQCVMSSAKSKSLTVIGGCHLLSLGSTVKLAGLPAFNPCLIAWSRTLL